jgi:hypothetical protein
MVPLTHIRRLAAACAFVVLATVAIPAHTGELAQKQAAVGTHTPQATQCSMLRRAIARRACQARLEQETPVKTAQNKR